jgi:adenosylhomocysteine nucleosidase
MNDIHYEVGLIATGDKFMNSSEDKNEILINFNAIACEMESGSIGHVCYVNNIPFGIIRSISDNSDSTSNIDYSRFLEQSALRAASVVKEFLNQVNTNE